MAKTVFGSHANTAHTWAAQSVTRGRAADGRMSFDGPSIYSYGTHYTIARFVSNAKGERAVLFNSEGYSVSTGKHRSHVLRALQGLDVPIFMTPTPERDPDAATITKLWNELHVEAEKFARKTPYHLNNALAEFEDQAAFINKIAKFFSIKIKGVAPAISAEVIAKVKARMAKRDVREAAKREARAMEYTRQQEKMKADYLVGGYHHLYDSRAQNWGVQSSFTEAEHAKHFAEWQVIQSDKVAAWRAGKPVQLDYDHHDEAVNGTLMRVKGDVIQTSRGAEFPVSHGKRAFQLIAECRAMGRFWEKNGHTIHLGNFQIDRIDADGTVHAGCHTVAWSEVERIAKELGVI